MRNFFRDILLTFLPVVTLFMAALPVLPSFAAKVADNEFVDKRDYMNEHINDISLLIVGNSQSEVGIDPSVFDSCYNLSMLARVSHYDAELLERYVPEMEKLATVVFPLLCEYEPGTVLVKDDWRERNMLGYQYMWGLEPPQELKALSPAWRHLYEKYSQVFSIRPIKRIIEYDSLGFFIEEGVGNGNNVYEAPGTRPMVEASLRRMARVCAEHGVRLIVVAMPCNSTYRAAHGDCDDRLQRLMDEVAVEYPAVEYRCYLNDDRFPDSLFSDQTHMNQAGATAFALRLKEDFGL